MIFSSDEIGENQLIMLFIKYLFIYLKIFSLRCFRNLKEQLKNDGYLVDDIHGDLNAIEGTEQMIFICTDRQNDYANHRIIQAVQRKINRVNQLSFDHFYMRNFFSAWCLARCIRLN
jgi:hypothetical protein